MTSCQVNVPFSISCSHKAISKSISLLNHFHHHTQELELFVLSHLETHCRRQETLSQWMVFFEYLASPYWRRQTAKIAWTKPLIVTSLFRRSTSWDISPVTAIVRTMPGRWSTLMVGCISVWETKGKLLGWKLTARSTTRDFHVKIFLLELDDSSAMEFTGFIFQVNRCLVPS